MTWNEWMNSSETFVCRQMNVHGPTCRAQTCSSHNDVQLQLCFSVPSVSVCLSTLSFASTSLVCQACSERYQRHWAWNPRFLQLSNKPHDTEKKQRKIWWSFFDYRGCSCLDFRRKGMQFDQVWGKCSQRTSLLDICLCWITYLGLPDLPQVMPHLEWWILIHKGRWNMLGLEHDVCMGFETRLRDICLQTDERPWAHMPCTNMQLSQRCSVAALFFCSLCLCLLIYLIFWFHIPGMSGLFGKVPATLSLESQIPSIVQQATWYRKETKENLVEFFWLSWVQLSRFSANRDVVWSILG